MSNGLLAAPAFVTFVRSGADVLAEAARVAAGPTDLEATVERFAGLMLEATDAFRVSVFELEEGGELRLWAAASRARRDEGWEQGLGLGTIPLDEVPARRALLSLGKPLAVHDARSSELVPDEWCAAFDLGALVIAPMVVGDGAVGIAVADWPEPMVVPDAVAEVLGTLAGSLALAVAHARLTRSLAAKTRSLERLLEVAAALNSSSSLRDVLELICGTYEELLGASHVSVNLVGYPDRGVLRALAVRGVPWFTTHPDSLGSLSAAEVTRIGEMWLTDPVPLVYPDASSQDVVAPELLPPEVQSAAVFPLAGPSGLLGAVVVGLSRVGGPGPDGLATGEALADLASTAIGRADLHECLRTRLQEVETLYRLSGVVAGTRRLRPAIRAMNELLRPELGVAVRSIVAVAGRAWATVDGTRAPTVDERAVITAWRHGTAWRERPAPVPMGEGLLVPMLHRGTVHGALQVEVLAEIDEPHAESLLLAVAAGCAEVLHESVLRQRIEHGDRRLAVAAERERIANDLHDSVGHVVTAIGLRLAEYLPDAPDRCWHDRLAALLALAGEGSRELRDSIYALLFLETRQAGLVSSLERLAARFEATTGVTCELRVSGSSTPALRPGVEEALFRVAHGALMNVERHACAELVTIGLSFGPRQVVTLTVRDDGTGLVHRDPFEIAGRHFGLRGMRERVQAAGGRLTVANARPRGVVVEVMLPASGSGAA